MLLARAVGVGPGEAAPALWSFGYFFCLLSSYYLLRPVRDALAAGRGTDHLPWLFTGTFVAMALLVPVFGALAARYPRRTLLPVVYVFFIVCILGFALLLRGAGAPAWAPGAFFIWLSVFNLFVVSVFWSVMADVWREDQARRLFGFIAAGGSAGALVGPAFAALMAPRLGPANLLPIGAVILTGALVCIARLRRHAAAGDPARHDAAPLGGGALDGVTLVLRSPYLLGVCAFMALATTLATFVYFQQAQILGRAYVDAAQRTAVFALMDLGVNALTIVTQLFVTGSLITRLGLARTLPVLPALSLLGFAALAVAPAAAVLVTFQIGRRAAQYAITGPSREILFTVVSREEKYKAKSLIDTVVYRGGDALSGWTYAGLTALGLGMTGIALVALPLAAVWIALAVRLGHRQERLRVTADGRPSPNFSQAGRSS